MKRPHIAALAVFITLVILSAFIASIKTNLGQPGVAIGSQPILDPDGNILVTNSIAMPPNVGFFTGKDVAISPRTVEWLPPDTTYGFRDYYDTDGFEARMQVVLMKKDRTSIHKPEYCLYGSGMEITNTEIIDIPMSDPMPYNLPATKISVVRKLEQPDGSIREWTGFYIYWFVSEDQMVPDHMTRIVLMATDLLREKVLKRWAYVSCLSLSHPGNEVALEKRMVQLIQQSVPKFQLTPPPDNLRIPAN